MFCLFRNTHLKNPFANWVLGLSWFSAIYWSYFTFIEKGFWEKFSSGQTMFVDLLLGLPLVIAMAIVLYAATFWTFKVMAIFLFPSLTYYQEPQIPEEDTEKTEEMESSLGKEYWQETTSDKEEKK